jgi:beta-galactosidase
MGEIIHWPMDFSGGVLKAVGRKGDSTTTFELKKAGPAAAIILKPDVSALIADGRDVAQIEVDVTDRDGTLVPDATNLITCSITGPAKIIGIENGDTNSMETYRALSHSAHGGHMMIYVQSLKDPGVAKLALSSPDLKESDLSLEVK